MAWHGSRFGSDRMIVLGSGGGRYMATTQRRSTGGFILQILDRRIQCHVDPGPSAARDLRDSHINPKKTSYIFLTHEHNDHDCEVPTIVEALQDDMEFKSPKGTLVAAASYFDGKKYFFRLLQRLIGMREGETVQLENGFAVTATPACHGDAVPNVGYVMEIGAGVARDVAGDLAGDLAGSVPRYRLAFTSDTAPFDGYVAAYRGVDVLVVNLLRPDDVVCRGHMCTDQLIPLLRKVKPAICILVHFGRRMDNEVDGDKVPAQARKIQAAIGPGTVVIGARDGQVIEFGAVAPRPGAAPEPGDSGGHGARASGFK